MGTGGHRWAQVGTRDPLHRIGALVRPAIRFRLVELEGPFAVFDLNLGIAHDTDALGGAFKPLDFGVACHGAAWCDLERE